MLEGCGCVDAATENVDERFRFTFEAFVTGATESTVILEAPEETTRGGRHFSCRQGGGDEIKTLRIAEIHCTTHKTPPTLPEENGRGDSRGLRGFVVSARPSSRLLPRTRRCFQNRGDGAVSRLAGYDEGDVRPLRHT